MKEVTFFVRRVSDEVQLKWFRPLAFLINDMTIVSKQDELPGLTTTIKGDLLEKEGVGSILPRKTLYMYRMQLAFDNVTEEDFINEI